MKTTAANSASAPKKKRQASRSPPDEGVKEPRASERRAVPAANNLSIDVKVDKEVIYEFGGPVGVTIMMFFFPALMYYLWICCEFYQGTLIRPNSFEDIIPFFARMG